MFLKDILGKIGVKMDSFTICTPFFEMTMSQNENTQNASWQLYVELITRVATQPLLENCGDEESALESIYKIFNITREIIKQYGREAETFSMLSLCLLNMILRPFTSKWHKVFKDGPINEENQKTFREELCELQIIINKFSGVLFQMSRVDTFDKIKFEEIEKIADLLKNGYLDRKNEMMMISDETSLS
jgi:hypothetical protein